MLLMNMVLGIDDIERKLQIRANLVPKLKIEFQHPELVEHTNFA